MESKTILAQKEMLVTQDFRSRDRFIGQRVKKGKDHTCVGQINDRKIDLPTKLANIRCPMSVGDKDVQMLHDR